MPYKKIFELRIHLAEAPHQVTSPGVGLQTDQAGEIHQRQLSLEIQGKNSIGIKLWIRFSRKKLLNWLIH